MIIGSWCPPTCAVRKGVEAMERREIVFSGRVQGVGFRATAAGIAARYEVTGWVRNEEDRSVRMQIQGAGEEIDRCLAELRRAMAGNIRQEHATGASVVSGESRFQIQR